jgi:excisionase family DNA binding protein
MSYLTVKEAAGRLQVSAGTIYQLCAEKRLAHVRVGSGRGTIRISEEALEQFVRGATVLPLAETAPSPPTTNGGQVGFKHLDAERLLAAWRRQGVLADPPDERNAPSSSSSCDPSTPPGS